jgi:hypothetical protein
MIRAPAISIQQKAISWKPYTFTALTRSNFYRLPTGRCLTADAGPDSGSRRWRCRGPG